MRSIGWRGAHRCAIGAVLWGVATFGAASASATTYYASPASVSTTSCTSPASPCRIGYAIGTAASANGDEVVLQPGVYEIGSTGLATNKAIDIHGQPAQPPPLIEGTTSNPTALLTLGGGTGTALSDLHLLQHGSGADVQDNGGSTIDRVVAQADAANLADGFVLNDGTTLRDSVALAPGNTAVFIPTGTVHLDNVTTYGGNGISANGAPGGFPATNVTIENTITHGTNADVNMDTTFSIPTVHIGYSNYDPSRVFGTADTTEGHNQNAATSPPALRGPAAGDFRELASSPTVGAGLVDQLIGTADVAGLPRTQNGGIDIGAHELLAPIVITGPPKAVGGSGASLSGTVDPEGGPLTQCVFEYGTTTSYGTSVACDQGGLSGTLPAAVSAAVSGLASGTTFHYRVMAHGDAGSTTGDDETFTTTTTPPTSTPPPSPVTAATITGKTVKGATLTCQPGTWRNAPTFSYAWLRDAKPLPAQTKVTYVVTAADAGHVLQCLVDATNAGGSALSDSAALLIPAPSPTRAPTVAIRTGRTSVSNGRVRIGLACNGTTGRCTGTLKLTHGRATWGSATFSAAAGRTANPSVKLSRGALQALATARGHRVSVTATAASARRTVVLTL
jgi:hypothetical protein